MKKSIFLFFAAILCAIGMSAATPEKLYLTPNSNWKQNNARFAAYFFGNGEKWVSMTKVAGETDLYEVAAPAGYPKVIFCRMNPGAAANSWGNKWNQTGDLIIPTDGKNHFTVPNGAWDNSTTAWSIWPIPAVKTYKDITFTITASSAPQIHYWEGGDKMVGSDWNNLPTMSETAAGSGVYTYTVKDVDEFTGVKYLFKLGDLQTADQTTSADVTANLKEFFPKVAVMGVNDWDGTDVMTVADDYLSASITLPLTAKRYDLKLTVDGLWKGHKDQNNITREKNSSVFKEDNGNGSITADYAGDYVFTYTYANQTLTVTYPELPAVKTYKDIVITVVANVTPKIHYWAGGDKVVATEWETKPDMVATGDANTYSYTIKDVDEALGVKYIIVAGTAQTEELHTTDDVTANFKDLLPAVEVMGIKGWNAGDGIPMTIAEDYSASATINFTEAKTQEFKLTVGGAWKGHSTNNKITRANNSSAFTEDNGNASVKVDVAGDYVFTYTYSDKKLTVTYPASDEPIVPHYYVVGSFNEWNTADPNYELILEGEVYKKEVTFAKDVEFKVCDGTWDAAWGAQNLGDNKYKELEGTDNLKMKEEKTFTIIFNPAQNLLTFEDLTPEAVVTYDYYVIGTVNEWGLKDAAYGMELNGDIYEKEVALAIGTHELKINNGTWDDANTFGHDQLSVAYEGVSRGSGEGDNNIVIELTEAKTVTVKLYKNTKKITLGGLTEKAPEPTFDYYIVGSFNGNDPKKAENGMTLDGTVYKATVTLAAGDNTLKVTKGSWDPTWGANELGAAYEEVSNPNDYNNIKITLAAEKEITVIFDGSKITFEGLTEIVATELVYKVTVPAGTPNCYIVFGDAWEAENAPAMTKVDDTHYTYTRTGLKSDQYKYLYGQSWDFVEVRAGNRTWAEEDVVENWNNPYTEVRTALTAGNYYTICMTKEMKQVKGATLWSFCGKDANFAYLVQEEAPYTAGKAYIMYAEAETVSAILTGDEVLAPVANADDAIRGTFVLMEQDALDAAGSNIYLVIENQLRRVSGQTGNKLPANRAYVDIDKIKGGAPAGIPANRVRSMPMQPQVATGMENVDASAQPVKTIINGQLYIFRGEKMYDAQGKLVK